MQSYNHYRIHDLAQTVDFVMHKVIGRQVQGFIQEFVVGGWGGGELCEW